MCAESTNDGTKFEDRNAASFVKMKQLNRLLLAWCFVINTVLVARASQLLQKKKIA